MMTTPSSEGREGVWSKRPFTGSNYQLLWFEDTSENTLQICTQSGSSYHSWHMTPSWRDGPTVNETSDKEITFEIIKSFGAPDIVFQCANSLSKIKKMV